MFIYYFDKQEDLAGLREGSTERPTYPTEVEVPAGMPTIFIALPLRSSRIIQLYSLKQQKNFSL